MHIKEAMAASKLLQRANPAALAQLSGCGTLKRVRKGEVLFQEKEEVHTLYIMAKGMAALCKNSDGGERRVIFLCGPGATLNEVIVAEPAASVSCEILQEGLVLCFPIEQVRSAMAQDFGLAQAMMESMAKKIRRLYRQMKNTSNALRGDKRLAAKLWKLTRDHGEETPCGTVVPFELTITFLADMLGSKRETVSRQMKLLTDAGLVRFCEGTICIPDRSALKKYFQAP